MFISLYYRKPSSKSYKKMDECKRLSIIYKNHNKLLVFFLLQYKLPPSLVEKEPRRISEIAVVCNRNSSGFGGIIKR